MKFIEKIVAPPGVCGDLVTSGIGLNAIFCHLKDGEFWGHIQTDYPNYLPGRKIPAWTKAELDVMIGPRFEKPDLWKEHELRTQIAQEQYRYPLIMPDSLRTFSNGAECSAEALLFLLRKGHVTAAEANERYEKMFGPFDPPPSVISKL